MGSEWKLPNWHVRPATVVVLLSRSYSQQLRCPFCSYRTALGERIQKLVGIFLMLLPLPSQFCKQVRDYGVQKHQPEVLPIYSKMLGTKREIQASQKFTLILCWGFFVDGCEPHDSLSLQPYQSVLHFLTWVGYKLASDCLVNFGGGKLLQQS